jgi:23S rRNA (cytosine1962-C5)-methyltransferase
MITHPRLTLRAGKERALRARHPWVFSGAVERVDDAADGDTVDICASDGAFLARGYYNSRSQIAARAWTFVDEPVDREFLARRIARAVRWRSELGLCFDQASAPTTAFRLINAEADLLPGLVVDAYGSFLCLQALTAGVARRLPELVDGLTEALRPAGIYERSDVDVRAKEGLEAQTGVLRGAAPPPLLEIREHDLRFVVDLRAGHKTGFYLDQRDNRRRAAELLARLAAPAPAAVLNAFAYSGAFGVYVARAWETAEVTNLDASTTALDLARENFARNDLVARGAQLAGDAFELLRRCRDSRRTYDVIILDPPKFAHSRSQLDAACRGYKDLNLLALKLLRPGGVLFTFSCSGLVSAQLFRKVVADAALDAGQDTRLVAELGHGADHPLLLSFPEGDYLKGLVVCVG